MWCDCACQMEEKLQTLHERVQLAETKLAQTEVNEQKQVVDARVSCDGV